MLMGGWVIFMIGLLIIFRIYYVLQTNAAKYNTVQNRSIPVTLTTGVHLWTKYPALTSILGYLFTLKEKL